MKFNSYLKLTATGIDQLAANNNNKNNNHDYLFKFYKFYKFYIKDMTISTYIKEITITFTKKERHNQNHWNICCFFVCLFFFSFSPY